MGIRYLLCAVSAVLGLAVISLFTGTGILLLFEIRQDVQMQQILLVSRIPRTLALLLAGAAMPVAGVIMQLITQNRFVDPPILLLVPHKSASLGLIITLIVIPAASVIVKMIVAVGFALVGTFIFMLLLRWVYASIHPDGTATWDNVKCNYWWYNHVHCITF